MTTPNHQDPHAPRALDRFRTARERFTTTSGATTLILRAFLGITFTFAGLQKLANPNFFDASNPASFQSQVRGAMSTSPIHSLLGLVNHAPVVIGVIIACGEVTVGIGTLVGLFGRVAALGGMLLSLSFFFTISYSTSPYYYGSDIVFVFAWTPLVLGGSGVLSLDELLRRRYANELARHTEPSVAQSVNRRDVLDRLATFGFVGLATAAIIGVVTGVGRSKSSAAPTTTDPTATRTTPTSQTTSGTGTKIASAAAIAVGQAAAFTDPSQQIPAFIVHLDASTFVAFSAICTHAGCTVSYVPATMEFACPCHGSLYDAKTGDVLRGPAIRPLPSIEISQANGNIYAED